MIRRSLITLSLCCAVLSAFIGFLSYRAIEEEQRVTSKVVELSCFELMQHPPESSSGIQVDSFYVGRHVAELDTDGDDQWNEIAIPLFPKSGQPIKYGYRAVIACCKGIPDQEALDELFESKQLIADYWPSRQEVPPALHSMLAEKYRNLDFAGSPVVFHGYEKSNPLLGKTTLKLSISAGAVSLLMALATLIFSLLAGLLKKLKRPTKPKQQPIANRAGLPAAGNGSMEPTGGVLDRVTSMRR